MFVDRVTLKFAAGKGGDGIISWKREKYIPKGGPGGGNGGKGASIILEADHQIHALEAYRNRKLIKAKDGANGGPNCRQGQSGEDLILKVPCGTLVKTKAGEVLHDLTVSGERYVLCQGGRGGLGNNYFKSATHQAPNICTPGKPGEEKEVELELKLIADVGLVGFPNAGKSTFLATLAKVPVKIAPYPFTTLRPNLGYIYFKGGERLLIADIPGIIEGASKNRGLGLKFLRHIERTNLLIYILDASGIDGRNPTDDFRVLRQELEAYDPALLNRPYLVLLNKMDAPESVELARIFKENYSGNSLFELSLLTGEGVVPLLSHLAELQKKLSSVDQKDTLQPLA